MQQSVVSAPHAVPWWQWPFEQTNASAVAGWGFWFAIVGLLFTLVGFVLTLRQLSQTRKVAEATQQEARRIGASLRSYDAAQETARARLELEAVKRHLKVGDWPMLADRYEEVRLALVSLREHEDLLSESIISTINSASDDIMKLCNRIDKDLSKISTDAGYARVRELVRMHGELLEKVSAQTQRKVI